VKYVFYLIATFLIIIWAFLFWGFNLKPIVHLLPVIAVIIAIVGILFDKELLKKIIKKYFTKTE
jgi:flagellar motor component MotA